MVAINNIIYSRFVLTSNGFSTQNLHINLIKSLKQWPYVGNEGANSIDYRPSYPNSA